MTEHYSHVGHEEKASAVARVISLVRIRPVRVLIWVDDVRERGLEEVRQTPGNHDESLKGSRAGRRSIRLSKHWRAIYEVHSGIAKFVMVEEVTPHKY